MARVALEKYTAAQVLQILTESKASELATELKERLAKFEFAFDEPRTRAAIQVVLQDVVDRAEAQGYRLFFDSVSINGNETAISAAPGKCRNSWFE